ncbi:hypothetical protein NA78x_004708 [Anatilimnocola sp. NA78]|uniref:hypothetical protein n=1 Tax=Anatilimnocola sp. NA78 TaxID=3415683 RepID=UPI003CE50EB5
MKSQSYHHHRRRRGAAMMTAIVLLAVVVIIMGVSLRHVATSQRLTRQQTWQMQAELLAQAAIERARLQLAQDNGFRDETWTPTVSGSASQAETGRVVIAVTKQDDEAYRLIVTALFPDHPVQRAQVQTERVLSIPTNEE